MEEQIIGCRADIGSLTAALKAQKALSRAAIPTTVIKNEPTSKSKGCSYGLSFSCAQAGNLQNVLEREGIRVKRWIQGSYRD